MTEGETSRAGELKPSRPVLAGSSEGDSYNPWRRVRWSRVKTTRAVLGDTPLPIRIPRAVMFVPPLRLYVKLSRRL